MDRLFDCLRLQFDCNVKEIIKTSKEQFASFLQIKALTIYFITDNELVVLV